MAQKKKSETQGEKALHKVKKETGTKAPAKKAAKKAAKKQAGSGRAKNQAAKRHCKPPAKPVEHKGEDEPQIEEKDPFEIARQTVKGSVPAIVKTMVEKAKKGSCPHAKTLLEMTGAKYMFEEEAGGQHKGEPWEKLVLERLGERESLQGEEVSTQAASE